MILDEIVRSKRAEVRERRRARPLGALRREAEERKERRLFRNSLRDEGISLIAEVKRASPSAGPIREGARAGEIAEAYERGGASALSVLTDGPFFGGSLADLREARGVVSLPVLRKDFVIDEYSIVEACAAGADAVLLIAAILSENQLADFLACARELRLDALVEVHTERELERVLEAGAGLVGVNNRDLETFETDLSVSLRLAEKIPAGVVRVSESGISGPDDCARLRGAGFDAVLVGEYLMRASSPIEEEVKRLLGGAG